MLRKQVLRNCRLLIIALLYHIIATAQSQYSNDCHIIIDGHTIPLFGEYNQVKKQLLLAKDIENLDKLGELYYYDGKIIRHGDYMLTPQIGFIIDTSTGHIVKHSISYIVTHRLDKGNLKKASVEEILHIIKQENLPFLTKLPTVKFGERQTFTSSCGTAYITVSAPEKLGTDQEEMDITIKLAK
jgi:hypothetical protein